MAVSWRRLFEIMRGGQEDVRKGRIEGRKGAGGKRA